jgi:hypothetical protein
LREAYDGFEFELSLSPITVCQDRLILIYPPTSTHEKHEFLDQLLSDRIVTYTLSRLYVIGEKPIVSTRLSEMIMEIYKKISSIIVVRMHAFPKFIPVEKIATEFIERCPLISFNPKTYDHVLSIVYANGLWYSSLAPADMVIGSGSHLYKGGSEICLGVSKASQKLFESCIRWPRLMCSHAFDQTGKTCLDIGASPGGWSYFMALELKAGRVIAVDNGLLSDPKPGAVEHWKMRGEEAIEFLHDQRRLQTDVADQPEEKIS